ncbi:T9SS type A sorting domain-containing protein, partial [Bacteroidales bacterium OttesenSCG-928-K22]|nr:T9SS type A sorting domain-containing protein [Bacteroidales bacterium OttesenSCG-928-K22]
AEWINIRETLPWNYQQTRHYTANETINILGNTYYKILFEEEDVLYVRETENKKVYAVFPSMTEQYGYEQEVLLYDFEIKIGDTIFFDYRGQTYGGGYIEFEEYPIYYVVTDFYNLELSPGSSLKGYRFERSDGNPQNCIWVEGIGSLWSIFGPYDGAVNLNHDKFWMTCFYHEGALLFKHPYCTDCFCGVGIEDNNISADLSIYPNPSNDVLCVEFSDYQIKEISIFDITGKETQTINNVNANITNVNITNLAKGIYNLRINTECGKTACGKFVKE